MYGQHRDNEHNPFFPGGEAPRPPEPAPWPIPDAAVMARRRAGRDQIFADTPRHRRVYTSSATSSSRQPGTPSSSPSSGPEGRRTTGHTAAPTTTARNICHILFDRQTRGSSAYTRVDTRVWERPERKRDRSPSTVLESPAVMPSSPSSSSAHPEEEETAHTDNDDGGAAGSNRLYHAATTSSRDEAVPPAGSLPRRVIWPLRISGEIRRFLEYQSAVSYHSAFLPHLGGDDTLDEAGNRPASSRAVSTISVAFSPDGQSMASTHGDHTVKISCCTTGRLLQSLEGHPRTPWTVKYHPTDAHIVASGCLGHQVRVWNWVEKTCLQMVRLEFAIISLSFHPSGRLLAVANGTRLHFWGMDHGTTRNIPGPSALAQVSNRSALLTEMDQRHMLRCVHFPPDGKTLIIGGVNPTPEDPRRRGRGGIGGGGSGISFYLRLWDFDADISLQPPMETTIQGISVPRRAISNVRVVTGE
jgi:activator-of-BECN1-regulated-autophagy protein 1